jgi:hypothetical protein
MERRFWLLLAISINLVIIAILVSFLAALFFTTHFPDAPVIRDLIWESLPFLPITWVSEIVIVISIAYMFIWSLKKDKYLLPYIISLLALFNIIRAFLYILTPMSFPNNYSGFTPDYLKILMTGAFPSGHFVYPVLAYFLTRNRFMILLIILSAISLLMSNGHYSIDIIGTLVIGFGLYKFSEKYLKKYFNLT